MSLDDRTYAPATDSNCILKCQGYVPEIVLDRYPAGIIECYTKEVYLV